MVTERMRLDRRAPGRPVAGHRRASGRRRGQWPRRRDRRGSERSRRAAAVNGDQMVDVERDGGRAGLRRPAHATCASPASRTRRRSPPAPAQRRPAASRPSARCRTPTRPSTRPPTSSGWLGAARRQGVVRVHPIGTITRGEKGQELSEMADMASAGAVAFSDDGQPGSQRTPDAERARVQPGHRSPDRGSRRGPRPGRRRRDARRPRGEHPRACAGYRPRPKRSPSRATSRWHARPAGDSTWPTSAPPPPSSWSGSPRRTECR